MQHASMSTPPPEVEPTQRPLPFTARQLPVSALLYLATLGGAQVCCLADHVGSLDPGKSFDALLVSVRPGHGNPGLWGVKQTKGDPVLEEKKALEKMLETFLFCGDDRNIRHVYVQGKRIGGSAF
jgi:guanine deaminase